MSFIGVNQQLISLVAVYFFSFIDEHPVDAYIPTICNNILPIQSTTVIALPPPHFYIGQHESKNFRAPSARKKGVQNVLEGWALAEKVTDQNNTIFVRLRRKVTDE